MELKKEILYLLEDEFEHFEGYIEPGSWRGFSKPWFDETESANILNFYCWKWTFDKEKDMFGYYNTKQPIPDWVWYKGRDFIVNGVKLHLYPIGNSEWEWDTVE